MISKYQYLKGWFVVEIFIKIQQDRLRYKLLRALFSAIATSNVYIQNLNNNVYIQNQKNEISMLQKFELV